MSNLLQVVRLQSEAVKKGALPVLMEFQVEPESAPYLVSSTKGLLWIEEAHPGKIVKAAVRQGVIPGEVFLEVLNAIVKRGKDCLWGNTHPFSEEGVKAAIEYVKSYDLTDLELLIPRLKSEGEKKGPSKRPSWLNPKNFQLPCRPTSWIPADCVVVVPRDRQFVGLMGHLNAKTVVVFVPNASRGVAVAMGKPTKK